MSVGDVSIISADGSKELVADENGKFKVKILVPLMEDVSNIQIYCGVRGFAKALRLDFGSELSNRTHLICSHNQLIHDSMAPGTGGGLFKGQHSFTITFDLNAIREKGVEHLPPTCAVALGDAYFKVRYMIKVLIKYTGMFGSYSKDCLEEVLVREKPTDKAWKLCDPTPLLLGNFGAPGTPRPSLYSHRKVVQNKNEVQCLVTLSRRAVLAGDTFKCVVSARPARGKKISHCMVKVVETLDWSTENFGMLGNNNRPCVVASATDDEFGDRTSDTPDVWAHTSTFALEIPQKLLFSIDVGGISHRFHVQVQVFVYGSNDPAAILEAPLTIIARGGSGPSEAASVPKFYSPESKSECKVVYGDIGQIDSRQIMGQRFEVCYPYFATKEFELDVQVGDQVDIMSCFENGFCQVVKVSDQSQGIIPLHHLMACIKNHNLITRHALPTPTGSPRKTYEPLPWSPPEPRHSQIRHLCKHELRHQVLIKNSLMDNEFTDVTPIQPCYVKKCISRSDQVCVDCLEQRGEFAA